MRRHFDIDLYEICWTTDWGWNRSKKIWKHHNLERWPFFVYVSSLSFQHSTSAPRLLFLWRSLDERMKGEKSKLRVKNAVQIVKRKMIWERFSILILCYWLNLCNKSPLAISCRFHTQLIRCHHLLSQYRISSPSVDFSRWWKLRILRGHYRHALNQLLERSKWGLFTSRTWSDDEWWDR